jgi:hypothetical protein
MPPKSNRNKRAEARASRAASYQPSTVEPAGGGGSTQPSSFGRRRVSWTNTKGLPLTQVNITYVPKGASGSWRSYEKTPIHYNEPTGLENIKEYTGYATKDGPSFMQQMWHYEPEVKEYYLNQKKSKKNKENNSGCAIMGGKRRRSKTRRQRK